jgi:hypothetical protein
VATATQLEHLPTDHDPPSRCDSTTRSSNSPMPTSSSSKIAPVPKRIGDATVAMLAYSGSIPDPTLNVIDT